MIHPALIPTYLHYGYLPTCESYPIHSINLNLDRSINIPQDDNVKSLVARGMSNLKKALEACFNQTDRGKLHVLPLSGGLDSRAILGALMENLDRNQIQTVTFGTPGTWDYEIGRQVARAFGVSCKSLRLTAEDWKWTTNGLVETALQTEDPIWVFDAYINRQIPRCFGVECIYWSGFMGDPLAGSHLLPTDSPSWERAKDCFVQRNQFVRSLNLAPPNFDPKRYLPAKPFSDDSPLCYDEQLDFGIRQQCLIRHIVLPKGYDYRTPFLHPKWVNFILNVPRPYRAKQYLYKEILKAAYPSLFSLPTKTNYGLSLDASRWRTALQINLLRVRATVKRYLPQINWSVSPSANYIDFDDSIRERPDLKQVINENIQDLKKRGVVDWTDIEAIWKRHQHKQGNHADALMLLASLELYLKAGESKTCSDGNSVT